MSDSNTAIRGTVLIDRTLVRDAVVIVRNGRIAALGLADQTSIPDGARLIDAQDEVVVPGFIDIHIHGSGGCRAEDDAVGMARHIIRNGTTYFLPTLISNDLPDMLEAIDQIRGHVGQVPRGATIGGIHLEGPFLNPRYGAQRPETNIEPDPHTVRQLIERCGEALRLVTLAPERRGAIDAIKAFRAAGAIVSIGHSDANEQEYLAGRRAGISHATHIFNAMPPKDWPTSATYQGTKVVGVEELILGDNGISADVMCDSGCAHVHASLLKTVFKCKAPDKLTLITDAMLAAGLPPDEYEMADGQRIFSTAEEDVIRLANGLLCGSALSMAGALRNFIKHTGVSLETALVLVSEAPARVIGLFDRKGSMAPGKDADIVLMDRDCNVSTVMVAGRIEFEARESGAGSREQTRAADMRE